MNAMLEFLGVLRLRIVVALARAGRFLRRRVDPVGLEPPDRFRAAADRRPPGTPTPRTEEWPPPVEGVDFALSDVDDELRANLEAIGRELAERVSTRHGRRRRRARTGIVAGVAAVVLVGGGAAATALLDSSSGLPFVDEAIERSARDRPADDPRPDPAPAARQPSPVVSVPSGIPGKPGEVRVYVSAAGDVCAGYVPGATKPETGGGGIGCRPGALVRDELRRYGAVGIMIVFDTQTVIAGVAASGAEVTGADGPDGPMEVRHSSTWPAPSDDLPALRVVAAFSGLDGGVGGRAPSPPGAYALVVRKSGETFALHPWGRPKIVAQP